MKVSYPCLYGLREYCEAVTLIMQQFQTPITPLKPKTDEEAIMKKLADAYFKYFPMQQPSLLTITGAIRNICELCPHRLAKLKELGLEQPFHTTRIAIPEPIEPKTARTSRTKPEREQE